MHPRAALVALLALAACREDPNALRNQGEACESCHRPNGKAPRSLFTVAGTVFRDAGGEPRETGAPGVAVVLTDAGGRRVELISNPAGNFYSREGLRFPVKVTLRVRPSGALREGPAGPCVHGDCNRCHAPATPSGGAGGRLVMPSAASRPAG
jgi:hypothetical protein